MKQYRITLFFVALIFCELPILGQIILSYDSVTICQGLSNGLQQSPNKDVIIPVENQIITLHDTTLKMVSVEANATIPTTGTLLFKEDFGGNAVGDPSISTTPISQCNLNFKMDGNPKGAGNYVIRKFSYPSHNSWYPRLSDHTHPNDTARGYLMQVDGSATAGQFYTCQIDNLCAEAELYLSVWGMGSCNSTSWTDASLTLVVKNLANTELGRQNITLEQGDGVWKQHGMPFKMPIGETSIIFSVINNTADASGNDFMLDDIEVRLCTPPVTVSIAPTDTVCGGTNVSMVGMFNNDGTFTEPLEYRWLYSATGDLTSQASWTAVGINATTLEMISAQPTKSGYYRLAVASSGSIDLENCRAMSDPVHLFVNQCSHVVTSINDTIVALACDSTAIIKFLSNDTYTCATPKISLLTKPTVLGAIATIQSDSLVYSIISGHAAIDSVQYSITCDGVSASAWAYFVVQSNSLITTEVFPNDTICKGENLLFSGKLTNVGTLNSPLMYQWQKSNDGVVWVAVDNSSWTSFGSGAGSATAMLQTAGAGITYYRLMIAELGDELLKKCFVTSSVLPVYVVQPTVDTLRLSGCGLVEYENKTFVSDSTFVVETQNAGGCANELTVEITVKPEPLGEKTVTDCDSVTYLGITYFHDTDLTERFSSSGECDSLFVTHIDVDNCLSGYLVEDLIVNKYDWIVLCNNTKAKKLVPNYEEIHYQWYKDGQKMIGELDDYYTEDRLLFGCFFLRLLIMAEGQAHPFISETLCINHENLTISPNPVTLSQNAVINYDFTDEEKVGLYVEIYNYQGVKITRFEPVAYPINLPAGLTQGVYYVKVITGTNRIFGVKLIVN
ncbi:MAG: T9SS type A sorting domain-containing protein [Paludibacteraceae bacterium]|nr:T9SS type A sorting domain-containing protein [Paludibacteraceae bacterium]